MLGSFFILNQSLHVSWRQVLAFFALTRVAEPEGQGAEFRKLQSTEEEERQPAGREEQQQEYDDVVREMLQVFPPLL